MNYRSICQGNLQIAECIGTTGPKVDWIQSTHALKRFALYLIPWTWPNIAGRKAKPCCLKSFATGHGPEWHVLSVLVHGHMALTVLTQHCISTNSSRSAEILSSALTTLSIEQIMLHVQADNCSKECKNNCLLRHFAFQIALKKLRGCQLSFLSSGHSHEDIDGMFSNLRAWLARHDELWDPESFQSCLQHYFDDPSHRPHEKIRKVIRMDRFRDWSPICTRHGHSFRLYVRPIPL